MSKNLTPSHPEQHREIIRLFDENRFGRYPEAPKKLEFIFTAGAGSTIDGKAVRRQVTVYLAK